MARIASQQVAAQHFKVNPRTVESWITKGYVIGYRSGTRVLVDLDQIDRELVTNPRMRDGRRPRYGYDANIVPITALGAGEITEVVADEAAEGGELQ